MKMLTDFRWTLLAGALLLPASWLQAQGDLVPPGPPAGVMKTLDQVEPRTPIGAAPFVITNSGSYYLTTNLTTTGNGVVIRCSRVTLDLMGYSITGDRGVGDFGVWLDGSAAPLRDIVIRNGTIQNFATGLSADAANTSHFHHLLASTNSDDGIALRGNGKHCNGNIITDCIARGNGSSGIALSGSSSGQCSGNLVADCTLSSNHDGIRLYGASSGRCDANRVTGCSAFASVASGIVLCTASGGTCNGNQITKCAVADSGATGIYLWAPAGGLCQGNLVEGCSVHRCSARSLYVQNANANRIDNNTVTRSTYTGTSYGISGDTATNNLIVRNFCSGHTYCYRFLNVNTYGPLADGQGELQPGGVDGHPWANFTR